MEQNLFLLSLTMSGIKNIEKEITLDFYKKTIDSNFNIDGYRVKAIYGENGSGKTGIVYGAYILKKLMVDSNYLGESDNQIFLREVINKKTKTLRLECDFYSQIHPFNNIYRYSICLSQNEAGRYVISEERLLTRKSTYATSKFKEVYCVIDGTLECNVEGAMQEVLKRNTANLLDKNFVGK